MMETVTNSIYFIVLVATELSNIIVSDFGAKKIIQAGLSV